MCETIIFTAKCLQTARRRCERQSHFCVTIYKYISSSSSRMPASRKVSPRQLDILITFCEENKDIALGRCSRGPLGHQMATAAWNKVAAKLNAVADGVTKSGDQWRRYWIELKAKTKSKGADSRRSATRTGGGPSKLNPLTPFELRILQNVVGQVAVEGLPGVQIPFDDPGASSSAGPTPEPPQPLSTPLITQPQPSTSTQQHHSPNPNIIQATVTEESCMDEEWLEDEFIIPQPSNELLSNPPDPSPAAQTPPPAAAPTPPPAAAPTPPPAAAPSLDLPPAPHQSSLPEPSAPHRERRRRRDRDTNLPDWAKRVEERRQEHEERMENLKAQQVAIFNSIDQKLSVLERINEKMAILERINENLTTLNLNLSRR